jgi:hypothetical protein
MESWLSGRKRQFRKLLSRKRDQRFESSTLRMANKKYKLVVFVPVSDAEKIRQAIHAAGGGKLGRYSHCSFSSRGTGRFMPEAGANPTVGEIGKIEKIEEEKIEFLCEENIIREVVAAMKKAHPYEEPAYDIFPLEDL